MTRPVQVLAVVQSGALDQALGAARGSLRGAVISLQSMSLPDFHPVADLSQAPDVLLLEIDPCDARDLEALERLAQRHFPGVPILVTATKADMPVVRQLMHLGVADFLPQPVSATDLEIAVERAVRSRRTNAPPPARGKIIAFLKAGGGVGATTLATQAALSMAMRRKAERGGICLLDLDIQFGTAALHLDLDDRIGLADLLDDPQRLDGELLRSVMTQHRSGLDVLAAPRGMVGLDAVSPELLDACLDLACTEYGTVILDLPGVWTPWTYRAVQCCDLAILVTQLGVAGVRQARRQIDAMAANGLGEVMVHVAVNRFESGWRHHVSLKDAERALGRPIDYVIANDYRTVSEAIDQGVSLTDVRRRSKAAQGIRRMIDAAVRATADAGEHSDTAMIPRIFAARHA